MGVDETDLVYESFDARIGKKGKRKKITANGGGDELTSWEVCVSMIVSACVFIKKGDGDIFYEQLQQLNDFVKKEWVEKEINRKTLKRRDQR